jgi:hypothetical protein
MIMHRQGRILSYSVVHSAAEAFKDKTPYLIALIEEDCGPRLARIEGFSALTEIKIGTLVRFSGEDEQGHPIYEFEPSPVSGARTQAQNEVDYA